MRCQRQSYSPDFRGALIRSPCDITVQEVNRTVSKVTEAKKVCHPAYTTADVYQKEFPAYPRAPKR